MDYSESDYWFNFVAYTGSIHADPSARLSRNRDIVAVKKVRSCGKDGMSELVSTDSGLFKVASSALEALILSRVGKEVLDWMVLTRRPC